MQKKEAHGHRASAKFRAKEWSKSERGMKYSHPMNKNMHLICTCVTLVLKLLPLCEDRCINLASSAAHRPGIERLNFNNMQELIPALPCQTNIFAVFCSDAIIRAMQTIVNISTRYSETNVM